MCPSAKGCGSPLFRKALIPRRDPDKIARSEDRQSFFDRDGHDLVSGPLGLDKGWFNGGRNKPMGKRDGQSPDEEQPERKAPLGERARGAEFLNRGG